MKIPDDPKTKTQAALVILLDCCRYLNSLSLDRETYASELSRLFRERTGMTLTRQDISALWCER